MTNIPKTFCPAKWDELTINLQNNYVYACCKAVPISFVNKEDIKHALDTQKTNLQNEIQDASCKYCWTIENNGAKSKRIELLNEFDTLTYADYTLNKQPIDIEVNLGNECNFQCIYCNPKFSSQWETDVNRKPYRLFVDQYVYAAESKNQVTTADNIDILSMYDNINTLVVVGGEPLLNKKFTSLVSNVKSTRLSFSSNLSCKSKDPIDAVLALAPKYNSIMFGVSLDSTGEVAEFTRYGLSYNTTIENLKYLIVNAPHNVVITINALMSCLTVVDIDNFIVLLEDLYDIRQNIKCILSYCEYPKMLGFSSLKEEVRSNIIKSFNKMQQLHYVTGTESVISVLQCTRFNNTVYNQMRHFLEEFSTRKKINIPIIYSKKSINEKE